MAWIDDGPISLPTSSVTRWVGGAMLLVALAGVGLGYRGAFRDDRPSLDAAGTQGPDQTTPARPIVEIQSAPPPPAASNAVASNSAADSAQAAEDSNAIAAKTEAAEEAQAKPSKPPVDIDDILTSQSEKPQAPAKQGADEGAPGAPEKGASEVPF